MLFQNYININQIIGSLLFKSQHQPFKFDPRIINFLHSWILLTLKISLESQNKPLNQTNN